MVASALHQFCHLLMLLAALRAQDQGRTMFAPISLQTTMMTIQGPSATVADRDERRAAGDGVVDARRAGVLIGDEDRALVIGDVAVLDTAHGS